MIPAAKDLWTNATILANFDRIPVGKEQKGDVAVWGASSAINSPEFGHTDIVLAPGFTGFDSNWGGVKAPNGYPAAHEVQHNYTDVLGFLRKKGDEEVYFTKEEIKSIVRGYTGANPGKGFDMEHYTKTPISQALIDQLCNQLAPYNEKRIQQATSLQSQVASLRAASGDSSDANLLGQALIGVLTKFGYKKQ